MNTRNVLGISLIFIAVLVGCPNGEEPLPGQWIKTYGGTLYDAAVGILQTADGGYIVAGNTVSFGAGGNDIWVLKLTSDGSIGWQKTYGAAGDEYAVSIAQTADGGYVVLGSASYVGVGEHVFKSILVLSLSPDGQVEWQKVYAGGGMDFVASAIEPASDGGFVLTGKCGYMNSYDGLVFKIDSDGAILWSRTHGYDTGLDYLTSIQRTADGGYVAAGYTGFMDLANGNFWMLKLASNGAASWQKAYGGVSYDELSSVRQTLDGGYLLAGKTRSFGAGGYDFWIVKTADDASVDWQLVFGGESDDSVSSIVQTDDGAYLVAGSTYSVNLGTLDIWLLKLSSSGSIVWQRCYGRSGEGDGVAAVQQTEDGGYILAGFTASFGDAMGDVWVLKIPAEGELPGVDFISDTSVTPLATEAVPVDTIASSIETGPGAADAFLTSIPSSAITLTQYP